MILKILNDKHPSLRRVCNIVEEPSKYTAFAMSMLTTMNAHKAVGLAANQVGKSLRIICINTLEFSGIMFNPEILESNSETIPFPEGCLSVKGVTHNTNTRAKTIKVRWQDKNKMYNEKEFTDLAAVVIQHEIDHLFGIIFTDYKKEENSGTET